MVTKQTIADKGRNNPSFMSYRGRARRRTYWCVILVIGVTASVAMFIAVLPFLNELAHGGMDDLAVALSRSAYGLFAALVIAIIAFLLLLPVSVRRLHDRNMSGWWLLAFLIGEAIPYVRIPVGIAQFVIMGCIDGTTGPNRFGLDPKGRETIAKKQHL